MDELKKAERSQRAAAVQPSPTPSLPRVSAPSPARRAAPWMAAVLLLLFGGGSAAYHWLAQPLPVSPATPGVSAPAPAAPVVAAAPAMPPPSAPRAYAALTAGDLALARSEYLRVLAAEPASLDALRGLATVSLREGQSEAAEAYYLRALKIDPQDALALAGLVGVNGGNGRIDPHEAEARLKALLAARPELAFLNYALGNLYAAQDRWSEAQQAFIQAYRAEPDNPDILFNLAVSFDHQRQPQQALSFYRLALTAAEGRPASFDRGQAVVRRQALEK